jgi:hypothetical protein
MSNHGLYPIIVFQSRYGGVYEGGEWFAISGFENLSSDLNDYFEGGDCDAVDFWGKKHNFPIAVGNTPNEAVNSLIANYSNDSNSIPYKEIITPKSFSNSNHLGFSNTHIERTGFYERSMGFASD